MATDPTPASSEPQVESASAGAAPALSRRRFLKSAAGVPLLVTVPAVSALAQSSAFNCAVKSQIASLNTNVPGSTTSAGNTWVRRMVPFRRFRRFKGSSPGYEQVDAWLIDGTWYAYPGTPAKLDPQPNADSLNLCSTLSPTPPPYPTNWCTFQGPVNRYVLEIYNLDSLSNPTSLYSVGAFPEEKKNGPPDYGPPENFALSISCMCSIDPGLDPNSPNLWCL